MASVLATLMIATTPTGALHPQKEAVREPSQGVHRALHVTSGRADGNERGMTSVGRGAPAGRSLTISLSCSLVPACQKWRQVAAGRRTLALRRLSHVRRLTQALRDARASNPLEQGHPLERGFLCIHRGEGSWHDPAAPYYGGLQMDSTFQNQYGKEYVRAFGTADHWPVSVQLAVAIKAYVSGRGFYPWPNTARNCGLIP